MSLRETLDNSSITVRELLGVIAKYDLRESKLRRDLEEIRSERMRLLEQLQKTFDNMHELESVKEELRLLKRTDAEKTGEVIQYLQQRPDAPSVRVAEDLRVSQALVLKIREKHFPEHLTVLRRDGAEQPAHIKED